MPDEAKFRCGALYCDQCRKTFYYRTHILPDQPEDEVYKCPECSGELREVLTDAFLDNTDDTLRVLEQLDEEARGG